MTESNVNIDTKLRGTDEEDSSDARDPENTHTDNGSLTVSDSPSTSFDRLRGLAGGFEIRRDDLRNGEGSLVPHSLCHNQSSYPRQLSPIRMSSQRY